jgi:adenosylhomocysteine nucleosidase
MKKIAVIIAVDAEAKRIVGNGYFRWRETRPGFHESATLPLSLAVTGVGKAYAAWGFALASAGAELVVSLGTSGGLGGEAIGDLYLCGEFVEHDMNVETLGFPEGVTPYSGMKEPVIRPCTEATLAFAEKALARAGLEAKRGRSVSGDRFMTDAVESAAMRDRFEANLCDMESAAIAKLCATKTGQEFFALRFISDNANHESKLSWRENVERSAVDFDLYLRALIETAD